MPRIIASWLGLSICGLLCGAAEAAKPNVLVILTDDTGWGEYGFQGNTQIPTPHIDSIAKQGVRFVQGYVSGPYCSPTRAGLMTGRYQTRFGHEFNSVAGVKGLDANETTMADRLKALGYASIAIGKWLLGNQPANRPTKRGFDEFFGTLGNTPFYHPTQFIDSRVSNDVQQIADDAFYTTEQYAGRAVEFLEAHRTDPWFMYLPFNAQHAPLQAPQKYLDRFPNITDKNRQLFAAMMSAKDDAVGRVLDKLRELGQEENTLVFFLSDNGGPTKVTTSGNGPLRGYKATTWEGGVRVPFAARWPGHIPAGTEFAHPIIQLDILPTALAAAGGTVDPAWKLDGVNLLPYLSGENSAKPHETLYWRFGEQWAIRHGDWKLLVGREGGKEPELYNLTDDLGESKNLATAEPGTRDELLALWQSWNAEQAPPAAPVEKLGKQRAKQPKQNRAKNKAKRAARAAAMP